MLSDIDSLNPMWAGPKSTSASSFYLYTINITLTNSS